MLFLLSRCLLLVLLIVIILLATKRMKRVFRLLLCIQCVVIISTLFALPVENLFIDFKTPENVFTYYAADNFIHNKIVHIEEGEQTCFIYYEQYPNSNSYLIIPKTEEGYKLPVSSADKIVVNRLDIHGSGWVIHYEGTDDYYLSVHGITDEENVTATDSNGKQLDVILKEIPKSESKTFAVLSYIDEFTNDYSVTINGYTIKFNQSEEALIMQSNDEFTPNSD